MAKKRKSNLTSNGVKYYDTLIVGGGVSAYSAAMYGARYNLKVLLIQENYGGYTATSGKVENYPGFKSIDGYDLMEKIKEHALSYKVEVAEGKAEVVSNNYHCFEIKAGKKTFNGKTVILAMGMEHRKLSAVGAERLENKGVHYCATCDGPLYKGKIVAVIGGGDSAVKAGNQMADMGAKKVYMIVREGDLSRAEPINLKRLDEKIKSGKVMVLPETEISEALGKNKVEAVKLSKEWKGKNELKLDGLFVEIGSVPRGELSKSLGVRLDSRGQIDVDPRTGATSIDGVFAAGDACNASGAFKQIITAAAQGAIAATSAYKDVSEHGGACLYHAKPGTKLLSSPKA